MFIKFPISSTPDIMQFAISKLTLTLSLASKVKVKSSPAVISDGAETVNVGATSFLDTLLGSLGSEVISPPFLTMVVAFTFVLSGILSLITTSALPLFTCPSPRTLFLSSVKRTIAPSGTPSPTDTVTF